jgi:hypothetical protein
VVENILGVVGWISGAVDIFFESLVRVGEHFCHHKFGVKIDGEFRCGGGTPQLRNQPNNI